MHVTIMGLIKKLIHRKINRIRLGRKTQPRMLGRRRAKSEESPADTERSKMVMRY